MGGKDRPNVAKGKRRPPGLGVSGLWLRSGCERLLWNGQRSGSCFSFPNPKEGEVSEKIA